MKKNLLIFIGSILGCLTICLLGTPCMVYSGITKADDIYSVFLTGNSIYGFLLVLSIFVSFISLVVVITKVVEGKKASTFVFYLSIINLLSAVFISSGISYIIKDVSSRMNYSEAGCMAGWGIIIVIILLLASFVLALIQYIIDMVKLRKTSENAIYDKLYRMKKLLDDGVISQEDYDKNKGVLLDKVLNDEI